jgi:hypothetical protein
MLLPLAVGVRILAAHASSWWHNGGLRHRGLELKAAQCITMLVVHAHLAMALAWPGFGRCKDYKDPRVVGVMYSLLDRVLVWQIRVKTLVSSTDRSW